MTTQSVYKMTGEKDHMIERAKNTSRYICNTEQRNNKREGKAKSQLSV